MKCVLSFIIVLSHFLFFFFLTWIRWCHLGRILLVLGFLNTNFFSTCEMVFILTGMSFAHKTKDWAKWYNAGGDKCTKTSLEKNINNKKQHSLIEQWSVLQETKSCLEIYTVRLYIIAWKYLFFPRAFFIHEYFQVFHTVHIS